jgi:hypothetical protein
MFEQQKEANSVVRKGANVSVKSGIRFQKIAERISRIDVDVVHKVRRRGDTLLAPDSGDSGSFFLDELQKMREINTDKLFTQFFESMNPYVQSLAQLVHHLPQIIRVLHENITIANEEKNDNIAAFFSLIAVLSRDTRQEFCPFFCTTLDIVVPLIDPSKPELTGEIFQLIAYLFKYLGKSLLQRLDEVRTYYASLLGHKKPYVRRFGAETLASLLRKLKDKPLHKHVRALLGALPKNEESATHADLAVEAITAATAKRSVDMKHGVRGSTLHDGVSLLVFELLKGMKHRMHSRGPALLAMLVDSLPPPGAAAEASDLAAHGACYEVLCTTVWHLLEHVRRDSDDCEHVWETLHAALTKGLLHYQKVTSRMSKADKATCVTASAGTLWLCRLTMLLYMATVHRSGSRVTDSEPRRLQHALAALLAPAIYQPAQMVDSISEAKKVASYQEVVLESSFLLRSAALQLLQVGILGKPYVALEDMGWKGPLMVQGQTKDASDGARYRASSGTGVGSPSLVSTVALLELALTVDVDADPSEGGKPVAQYRLNSQQAVARLCTLVLAAMKCDAESASAKGEGASDGASVGLGIGRMLVPLLVGYCGDLLCVASLHADAASSTALPWTEGASASFQLLADVHAAAHALCEPAGAAILPGIAMIEHGGSCTFQLKPPIRSGDGTTHASNEVWVRGLECAVAAVVDGEADGAESKRANAWLWGALVCTPLVALGEHATTKSAKGAKSLCDRALEAVLQLSAGMDESPPHAGGSHSWLVLRAQCLTTFVQLIANQVEEVGGAEAVEEEEEEEAVDKGRKRKGGKKAGANKRARVTREGASSGSASSLHTLHASVIQLLQAHAGSLAILRAVEQYLQALNRTSSRDQYLSHAVMNEQVLPFLQDNLRHPSHEVRLVTLRMLVLYPAQTWTVPDGKGGRTTEDCGMLEQCLMLEELEPSLDNERKFANTLSRLEVMSRIPRVKKKQGALEKEGEKEKDQQPPLPATYVELLARHLLGVLYVKLSTVWPPALKTMETLLKNHFAQAWPVVVRQMEIADFRMVPKQPAQISEAADTEAGEAGEDNGEGGSVVLEGEWNTQARFEELAEDEESSGQYSYAFVGSSSGSYSEDGMSSVGTDALTYHNSLWGLLQRGSLTDLVMRHAGSRQLVPFFATFLHGRYFAYHNDEPDLPEMKLETWLGEMAAQALSREEEPAAAEPGAESEVKARDYYGEMPQVSDVRARSLAAKTSLIVSWGDWLALARTDTAKQSEMSIADEVEGESRVMGSGKVLQKQLVNYLHLFSKLPMKGLYKNMLLQKVFVALLTHPDSEVSTLALKCLLAFDNKGAELEGLAVYKDTLLKLLDPASFRDALLLLPLGIKSGQVPQHHRATLLPVMMRLLYGRCSAHQTHNGAKAGKGGSSASSTGARRTAVISYLVGCSPDELGYFVELMLRPFKHALERAQTEAMQSTSAKLQSKDTTKMMIKAGVLVKVRSGKAENSSAPTVALTSVLDGLALGRQQAFLQLMGEVVRQLKGKVEAHLPVLGNVLVALYVRANTVEEEQDEEEEHEQQDEREDAVMTKEDYEARDQRGIRQRRAKKKSSQMAALRALCLQRASQLLQTFVQPHSEFDFTPWARSLLFAVHSCGHVQRLHGSIVGASKPQALLLFLQSLCERQELLPLIQDGMSSSCVCPGLMSAGLACVKVAALDGEAVLLGLRLVHSLLNFEDKALEKGQGQGQASFLLEKLPEVMEHICARLQARLHGDGKGKKAAIKAEGDEEEEEEEEEDKEAQSALVEIHLDLDVSIPLRILRQVKREKILQEILEVLVRLSQHLSHAVEAAAAVGTEEEQRLRLCSERTIGLLLPFVQHEAQPGEKLAQDVLQVFARMMPLLTDRAEEATDQAPIRSASYASTSESMEVEGLAEVDVEVDVVKKYLPMLSRMLTPSPLTLSLAGAGEGLTPQAQALSALARSNMRQAPMDSMGVRQLLTKAMCALLGAPLQPKEKKGDGGESVQGYSWNCRGLTFVGVVIDDLNAWTKNYVDNGYDMDRRLDAINALDVPRWKWLLGVDGVAAATAPAKKSKKNKKAKQGGGDTQATANIAVQLRLLPLLHQLLHCLVDGELSLRSASSLAISHLLDVIAAEKTSTSAYELLCRVLIPGIHNCLTFARGSTIRRHCVQLVREIVDRFPGETHSRIHGDLACLRNTTDPEADFFFNISHLQIHRQQRALVRLTKFLDGFPIAKSKWALAEAKKNADAMETEESEVAEDAMEVEPMPLCRSTLQSVLLPLVEHLVWESRKQTQQPVRDAAMAAMAAIARHLPWQKYYGLIRSLLKKLKRNSTSGSKEAEEDVAAQEEAAAMEAPLIKAFCEVLNVFPLPLTDLSPPEDAEAGKAAGDKESAEAGKRETYHEACLREEAEQAPEMAKYQSTLRTRIVPALRGLCFKEVTHDSGAKSRVLRSGVVFACVRAVRRLPLRALHAELHPLLRKVCLVLRSRSEIERRNAKDAVVSIGQELGTAYMAPIMSAIKDSLLEEQGYQAHVLSKTVHAVLASFAPGATTLKGPLPSITASPEAIVTPTAATAGDSDAMNTEGGEPLEGAGPLDPTMPLEEASDSNYFDRCIPAVLSVVMDDIFGKRGEQKEEEGYQASITSKHGGIREARGSASFDCFEILARGITFLPCNALHVLLEPILKKLQERSASGILEVKWVAKVEEVLRRVSVGLSQNKGVTTEPLLVFIHQMLSIGNPALVDDVTTGTLGGNSTLVENWVLTSTTTRDTNQQNQGEVSQKHALDHSLRLGKGQMQIIGTSSIDSRNEARGRSRKNEKNERAHRDVALGFALMVLHSHLKNKRLVGREQLHLQMLEPLVPLILRCAEQSKSAKVQMRTMQVMQFLCPWPLPSLRSATSKAQQKKLDAQAQAAGQANGGAVQAVAAVGHATKKTALRSLVNLSLRHLQPGGFAGARGSGSGNRMRMTNQYATSGSNASNDLLQVSLRVIGSVIEHHTQSSTFNGDSAASINGAGSNAGKQKPQAEQQKMQPGKKGKKSKLLSQEELRLVLSRVRMELDENQSSNSHNAALSLLKAVVAHQWVIVEVYELMDFIQELLVTSQRPPVQSQCSRLICKFILFYPLGEKRLQQHLHHLLQNLEFRWDSGRLAVIRCLQKLVSDFPAPVFAEYAQLLFLPLALRLAHDESFACREEVTRLIGQLLKRADGRILQGIVDFVLAWCGKSAQFIRGGAQSAQDGEEEQSEEQLMSLHKLGLQIAVILLQAAPKKSGKWVAELLDTGVCAGLQWCMQAAQQGEGDSNWEQEVMGPDADLDADSKEPGKAAAWELGHQALVLFERLLLNNPDATHARLFAGAEGGDGDGDGSDTTESIRRHERILQGLLATMSHPNINVRAAAASALGACFGRLRSAQHVWLEKGKVGKDKGGAEVTVVEDGRSAATSMQMYLQQPGVLMELAQQCCYQLEDVGGAEAEEGYTAAADKAAVSDLTSQTVKNLLFLSEALWSQPQRKCEEEEEEEEEEAEEEENGATVAKPASEGARPKGAGNRAGVEGVQWMVKRLCSAVRRKGDLRRASVFKFFAAFAVRCAAAKATTGDDAESEPEITPLQASAELALSKAVPYIVTALLRATRDGQSEDKSQEDSRAAAVGDAGQLGSRPGRNDADKKGAAKGAAKDDEPAAPAARSVKDLAEEVLALIEQQVGSKDFVKAYASAQKQATQMKEKRKRVRAMEQIVDPEAAANRKLKKNMQKRNQRKRKITQVRISRGKGVRRKKPRDEYES